MSYVVSVGCLAQIFSALCLVFYFYVRNDRAIIALLVFSLGCALAVPLFWSDFDPAIVAVLSLALVVAWAFCAILPAVRSHTVFHLAFRMMLLLGAALGVASWVDLGSADALVLAALAAMASLSALSLVRTFTFGGLSELLFSHPRRDAARKLVEAGLAGPQPRVTIHVPCYNEPPDLVHRTLSSLARLDYENYDVLVIDNNTKDPRIWTAIERSCRELGPRFRFHHVDDLPGAKAGALNYALDRTPSATQIVALVDADYVAEKDFLRFVPLFDDPAVGYVQTSHDYRNWRGTRFLRGAYYEYISYHKVTLPVLNEFAAGFTVGTMCLFRKEAIEKAGRWCETCLTEDSEIAIRLHAAGYAGHVFSDTVGRGLIPGNIADMKRQQFRWTAGPVQQLLMHWRLLTGLDRSARLSLPQRLLELHHSTTRLGGAIGNLFDLVLMFVLALVALAAPVIEVPAWVVLAVGAGMLSTLIDNAVIVRLSGGSDWKDQVYSTLVRNALDWTYVSASLAPLLRKELEWMRTDKFPDSATLSRAWQASRLETLIGVVQLATAGVLLASQTIGWNMATLVAATLLMRGIGYLCTPLMGAVAEADLTRQEEVRPAVGPAARPEPVAGSARAGPCPGVARPAAAEMPLAEVDESLRTEDLFGRERQFDERQRVSSQGRAQMAQMTLLPVRPPVEERALAARGAAVDEQAADRHAQLHEPAVELDRLQDRQPLGREDDEEGGARRVGQRLAQPPEAVLAAHQRRAHIVLASRLAAEELGARTVVRLRCAELPERSGEAVGALARLQEPARPRAHQLGQFEQPRRVARRRGVEDDEVVRFEPLLQRRRDALQKRGLHHARCLAGLRQMPAHLAAEPLGHQPAELPLDAVQMLVHRSRRIQLDAVETGCQAHRLRADLAAPEMAEIVGGVGGDDEDAPAARRISGRQRRGERRLADPALAAEEEDASLAERL